MAIADNIGYDAAGKNTYKIIDCTESMSADGARLIKETQQNDLFTVEVVKRRELKEGREITVASKETVLPEAGIVGELRRFIEAIENGTDDFFASALS